MASPQNEELVDRFGEFYRTYYRAEIAELAQRYPNEARSLHVDWGDLYRFDQDLADDIRNQPAQLLAVAEEALLRYDLPADVSLGQAHLRISNLPTTTDIRDIRSRHVNSLVEVRGIVRKATDVRPKIQQAAFECQRCGTLTRIPQTSGNFQEPHECQGCERQGPFRINFDQSEFIDAQKLRVQESPEGLRGGETPQSIDVNIEDDITGQVAPGDHVRVTGILHLEQQGSEREKSTMFDVYMEGVSVEVEDEQFDEMDITEEDKRAIVELSGDPDIYQKMVGSIAPTIYGYENEKLAMALQLFSGVTKHLPDGSRTRGDLHMLLIGDPGTGKCVVGDTRITLPDGSEAPIRDLVESRLDDPISVDDGVYQEVDFSVPSLQPDGSIGQQRVTKVWKRTAPDHLYRIRTGGGRSITVTPTHPLFVPAPDGFEPVQAERLGVGDLIAVDPYGSNRSMVADGGRVEATVPPVSPGAAGRTGKRFVGTDTIVGFETIEPPAAWVYDLEVEGTHNYISNGIISHNSQLLQYIRNIAPRSVYTSGKGSSAAGLCVTGDTLIQTADGRKPIRALVEQHLPEPVQTETAVAADIDLYTFDRETGETRLATTSHVWRMPAKPCRRLETDRGKELEASRQTPVLTRGSVGMGWKPIAEIEPGDYVAVPRYPTAERATPATQTDFSDANEKLKLDDDSRAMLRGRLLDRFETLRNAAAVLELSEKDIYHHHRNLFISVESIDKILEATGTEWNEISVDRSCPTRPEPITTGSDLATTAGPARQHGRNHTTSTSPGPITVLAHPRNATLEGIHSPVEEVDLSWEQVVEVKDSGRKEVFDLTVPHTHNFVGNGVVTHNTAAAVRDDFADGNQWTLEAGAMVLADQGIAAIDELDKMRSEDRSALHEALEQQSYHPDTEILFADGRRCEIGQFVDEIMETRADDVVLGIDCEIAPVDDVAVHTVDLETNEGWKQPVDRVSRHEAPDEFVKVSFSNGRSVVVTPDHPMFVERRGEIGTVDAKDLTVGAFVPGPRQLPNTTSPVAVESEETIGKEHEIQLPVTMSPDLAELLGHLIAGGHPNAGSANGIAFSNQDERLLDRVDNLVSAIFGLQSSNTTDRRETGTKRWFSTELYRWFESNFPEVIRTAREKRIPQKVLGASEEEIRRFLVGAFAGDGEGESDAVAFSTASRGLAEDYADALAKIGVASRIKANNTADSWKTYVMGDSIERFVDKMDDPADGHYKKSKRVAERRSTTRRHPDVLGPSAAREIRALRELLGLHVTGDCKNHIENGSGIPVQTIEQQIERLHNRASDIRGSLEQATSLADVRDAIGWSGRKLAERIDEATPSKINRAEAGGYDAERRRQLMETARSAVTDTLAEFEQRAAALQSRLELQFYRVTDVEVVPNQDEYETEWVYDVTVEPTHTFVSKGIILHNSISISKAGINATLKSRCSLLGAANPKYGRFDQYEPIGEQIDLEPALISRFDLIFTVSDKPDPDDDRRLADHILRTNYAGELNTQLERQSAPDVSHEEIETVADTVEPTIDPDLLRKYVAYAQQTCFPRMSDEAKEAVREFYVDLRSRGADEDAPVPVTARKLEALVRLAEASARIRLSDTVEREDADRVIEIVRTCLQDIGVDPETGEYDVDVIETGRSKSQRDRMKGLKGIIQDLQDEHDEGAPIDEVLDQAESMGIERSKAEHEIQKLRDKGEIYSPAQNHLRVV